MKQTQNKSEKNKILITVTFMVILILLVTNSTKILRKTTDVFVVSNGALYYEEPAERIYNTR